MKSPAAAKYVWLERMQSVSRQFDLTAAALEGYWIGLSVGAVTLPPDARRGELSSLFGSAPPATDPGGVLERTFTIRLFAVFEEACRRCWLDRRRKASTEVRTVDLFTSLHANNQPRLTLPMLKDVQEVRRYRNDLIHLNQDHQVVSFRDAKRRLSSFLKGLPEDWR